ncbi:unnamed protein product [Enterobius vermicularis]|uniref:Small ribosomal subunit protein mS31 n=1 Tax=Enterobius vermicularis TaxID=51028 RepID=A0A0N4V9B7_ENTVE|nr:unnamed protein product [Enterobius vermicularis]
MLAKILHNSFRIYASGSQLNRQVIGTTVYFFSSDAGSNLSSKLKQGNGVTGQEIGIKDPSSKGKSGLDKVPLAKNLSVDVTLKSGAAAKLPLAKEISADVTLQTGESAKSSITEGDPAKISVAKKALDDVTLQTETPAKLPVAKADSTNVTLSVSAPAKISTARENSGDVALQEDDPAKSSVAEETSNNVTLQKEAPAKLSVGKEALENMTSARHAPEDSSGTGSLKESSSNAVKIIGEPLYTAVKDVAKELYKGDSEGRKRAQKELIEKLAEYEKETFDTATASHTSEMLSDKVIVEILANVSAMKPKPVSRAAEIRHARRGLVHLRREIFYQAQQTGYSAEEARKIAQNAVDIATTRAIARSEKLSAERREELQREDAELEKKNEKEKRLFAYASQMIERMLLSGTGEPDGNYFSADTVEPYYFADTLFKDDGPDLGIFEKKSFLLHFLPSRIWNQLFGPKNGFEELIEWTKKGKMWPYPINNEYLLGGEENVSVAFHEHIFLDKELEHYKLPKTGPIAHFMELVCVGLSKNPYMTVGKKRDHLKWFVKYFDNKRFASSAFFFFLPFLITVILRFANFFDNKRIEEIRQLEKAEREL